MEFCLIGKKLGHSYSKIIHEKQGLCYSLVEIEEEGIENFIKNFDGGMNVTIPYKKAVIPYLDEVDGFAKEIGAVNTIVKIDGKLRGYNTDVFGMEYALKRARISLGGKRVMILGSGGTSLTARAVCKKNNASEVFVVSRSGEINYQNCYGYEVDVIINTTPVGMFPNEYDTPIDLSKFEGLEGVFDCIYNPLRTNLILQAQELGVKNSGGLAMLIAQGLKAEEIWLGKKIPKRRYEELICEIENEKRNIVLIGMPSCGKSTVAKELSLLTGKRVLDTDEMVKNSVGQSPSEIIEKHGEAVFRGVETEAVIKASRESGVIIATGGGAVLRWANVSHLKRNGILIYLERGVEKLIDEDRPLSKNGAISRLFEERKPIYEKVCDKKVDNNGRLESTVKEILSL